MQNCYNVIVAIVIMLLLQNCYERNKNENIKNDAFQYFTWMYMTIPPLDDSGWFVSLQALYHIYSPQAST